MLGLACGVVTALLGTALLLTSTIVGYGLMDGIIEGMIANEVALHDETIQMERFLEVPFPLNFTIRVFNITNREEVISGAIPVVNEIGPYIYKLYQKREVINSDEEMLEYTITEHFEFDSEASYPYTEDDIITIANVPYHAILQVAEVEYPELMGVLSMALNGVFGALKTPVASVRAGSVFLDGLPLCANPGLVGGVACSQIRSIAAGNKNMAVQPDGTVLFSVFGYKNGAPSPSYKVNRGVENARDLASIITYDNSYRLRLWPEGDEGSIDEQSPNACNSIRGTDTGIYAPFLNKDTSIYGFNDDICRSVELRYQSAFTYRDVSVWRYAVNEWFLDNHEGCFCLNLTRGVTGADGCLLSGAQELYSCVERNIITNIGLGLRPPAHLLTRNVYTTHEGGFLVLSYPHFLYADPAYRNGVIGMTPDPDTHRIWMDLEPNTGIVIRGAARVQFNVFLRPISRISGTNSLPNSLTPLFWVEEGLELPEEYLDELKEKLLAPLRLVDIFVPVLVAVSCVLLLVGGGVATRAGLQRSASRDAK